MRCQQEWLRLYRRVRSRTRRDDADDHLQNALMSYFERPGGSVQHQDAYITRSAVNSSLNAIRRERQGYVRRQTTSKRSSMSLIPRPRRRIFTNQHKDWRIFMKAANSFRTGPDRSS